MSLIAAHQAFEDFTHTDRTPLRRLSDFHNFVINCRRFTSMLNRLKNEAGYAEWWQPFVEELGKPLPKFFYELRTTLEHQSATRLQWTSQVTAPSEDFDGSLTLEWEEDGSGHRVVNPVTGERVALDREPHLQIDDDRLPDEYRHTPTEELMRMHLAILDRIMGSALARFGGQKPVH